MATPMQLTILGSGTCVPSLKRSSPSNYLKIGGTEILVDCGPGTLRQLEKARLDYKKIDCIFLTHFHIDHISELNAIIQALNWTPNFDRKKDLILVGPVGFKKLYKSYLEPISGKPRPNTYHIKIKEIKRDLKFRRLMVECVRTIHTSASIAYKFKENNKTLVISGDCDYDDNLVKFSKDCDILLLECSYPNIMKTKGHLIPKECGLIAKEANVKKLVITHLYPTFSDKIRLNQTRRIFKNTSLARDMMKINL